MSDPSGISNNNESFEKKEAEKSSRERVAPVLQKLYSLFRHKDLINFLDLIDEDTPEDSPFREFEGKDLREVANKIIDEKRSPIDGLVVAYNAVLRKMASKVKETTTEIEWHGKKMAWGEEQNVIASNYVSKLGILGLSQKDKEEIRERALEKEEQEEGPAVA